MGRPYTDAELVERIREVFEDEDRLEQHNKKIGWQESEQVQTQAAAFKKLRKFLKLNKVIR